MENTTNYVCVSVCEFTQISPTVRSVWFAQISSWLSALQYNESMYSLIKATNSIKANGNESNKLIKKKISYSRVVVSENYHLHAMKDVLLKNE